MTDQEMLKIIKENNNNNKSSKKKTNKSSLSNTIQSGLINMINPLYLLDEFYGKEGFNALLDKKYIKKMLEKLHIDKYKFFGNLGLDLSIKDKVLVGKNRKLFVTMTGGLWLFQLIQCKFKPFKLVDISELHTDHHLILMVMSASIYFVFKATMGDRPVKDVKKELVDLENTEETSIALKKKYHLSDYIDDVKIKKEVLPFMLGVDKKGKIITGDYFKMKNVLVVGIPGGGKSVMVHGFIQSLQVLNPNIQFVMVDFKIVELCYYEDFDNVTFVESLEGLDKALDMLLAEMEKRYKLMRRKATNISNMEGDFPFIMLVIDEVSEIKLNSDDSKFTDSIENKIIRLQNKGRAACIFTLIATQKPDAKQLNSNIKSNANVTMSCKIANKVTQNIVGVKGTEHLNPGEFKTVLEGQEEGEIYKSFFLDMSENTPKDHLTYTKLCKIKENKGGVNLEK